MSDEIERDDLERVRYARHLISEQFGHDPKRLIDYYMDLQQLYKSRFVDSAEEAETETKQTA
ncbi:MAG: hypothetical protein ABTQ93_09040 [Candidatus Competibacter denitrificans]